MILFQWKVNILDTKKFEFSFGRGYESLEVFSRRNSPKDIQGIREI